ncbi:hypothetical protein LP419_20985 [Massilia sp. H-1]|nr:hypothetical protein LP419_20985 [Massilia sp. H-1]
MEEDNATRSGPHAQVVGLKSWIAYLGLALLAVILFGVLLPLSFLATPILAAAVMLVSSIIVVYRFLLIRSVQLYYDDVGVWMYSGVLPWKKGIVWRQVARHGRGDLRAGLLELDLGLVHGPHRTPLHQGERNPAHRHRG